MGYNTRFSGTLEFTEELSASQIVALKRLFGADMRDNPQYKSSGLTYIDFEFTEDMKGLRHDGSEKSYDTVEKLNLLISHMQDLYPWFMLRGELLAQGEDVGDVWKVEIIDGKAVRTDVLLTGKKVTCPDCGHNFVIK